MTTITMNLVTCHFATYTFKNRTLDFATTNFNSL